MKTLDLLAAIGMISLIGWGIKIAKEVEKYCNERKHRNPMEIHFNKKNGKG